MLQKRTGILLVEIFGNLLKTVFDSKLMINKSIIWKDFECSSLLSLFPFYYFVFDSFY